MDDKIKEYMKGTTTVGIQCTDGVIIAADQRATMGFLIADKDAVKVHKIDDHLGLTIAGGVGDNQQLIRILKAEANLYKLQTKPMPVSAAATLLSNLLNQYKMYPFLTQLILGGYDTEPRLFELDMVGGMAKKDYCSTGSGSPVAYGVLEDAYRTGLSVEDGKKVVAKALKSALARDAATGNGVSMATITKDGFREVVGEDVVKLLK